MPRTIGSKNKKKVTNQERKEYFEAKLKDMRQMDLDIVELLASAQIKTIGRVDKVYRYVALLSISTAFTCGVFAYLLLAK